MIAAGELAGRGTKPKLAVVQVSELQTDVVTYGLIDLDRGFFTQRSIDVAGFAGSNFDHFPPLVLHSARNGDTTTWTLNALDVWSGALTPEMQIETGLGDHLNAASFQQEAGDRWIYNNRASTRQSGVYYTHPGQVEAQFVQAAFIGSTFSSTFWSNDFTKLAVEAAGIVTITNLETGKADLITQSAGPQAVVRWSPDDRYIAVSSRFPSDTMGQAIDVESREKVAEIEGDGLRWCGDRLLYTADSGEGYYEARLYDLETGKEEVLFTRDLSETPRSTRMLMVTTLSGQSCDWLMIFTGRPEAQQAELMHVESGRAIPFEGRQIRPYNVADGALTYLVEDARKTELRRIVLDPATAGYQVMASLDSLSTTLTWIDDALGAVYLRNGQMRRIDPITGREILLPGAEIQTFYLMP